MKYKIMDTIYELFLKNDRLCLVYDDSKGKHKLVISVIDKPGTLYACTDKQVYSAGGARGLYNQIATAGLNIRSTILIDMARQSA